MAAPRNSPHHEPDVITVPRGARMPAGALEPRQKRRTKDQAWQDDFDAEQAAGTIRADGRVRPQKPAAARSRARQAYDTRAARPQKRLAPPGLRPTSRVGGVTVNDASGFLLGLLAWGWIVLPYLRGGADEVTAVWRAKFLNKGPKGEPLL